MKNKSRASNLIIYLLIIGISILFIVVGNKIAKPKLFVQDTEEYYKAKVTSIGEIETESYELDEGYSYENKKIHFTALITSGVKKGETVEASQTIDAMYAIKPNEVKLGNKIIISYVSMIGMDEMEWIFIEYNRIDTLIWLGIIFLLLILAFGRSKGISTIISLVFTVSAVLYVYIPSILKGFNIYLSTFVVSIFIIIISLSIMNGVNKKTACAIIGNIGGVAVAGLIAFIMNNILNITGLVDEDSVLLMFAQLDKPINLIAIVWGGIVIGSLGAVMDVAMSISSAMNEVAENMGERTFSRLLKSGMNIGRDTIGTMTNTLILAYVGSSLSTVLLLIVSNKDILYLFNIEMIVVEVLQAIVGSLGILFCVPLTALFSAYVFTKEQKLSKK